MQHTTGVALVATQLAESDRRALSQAWYSALHLAERPPAARHAPLLPAPCATTSGGSHGTRSPNEASRRGSSEGGNLRDAARTSTARFAGEAAGPDRRAPKTELARGIERGLMRRPPHGAAASFAVHGAGGRVHLIVRSDGARTRIVAICAPPLRERVERALAHARFALAGRSICAEVA